jgi:hypothetical protein
MNERIKELWDKAAQAAAAYPSGQNNSWETQVNFMEKFAELIIRECAGFAEQKYGNWYRINSPDDAPGITIKKHFGVEE